MSLLALSPANQRPPTPPARPFSTADMLGIILLQRAQPAAACYDTLLLATYWSTFAPPNAQNEHHER